MAAVDGVSEYQFRIRYRNRKIKGVPRNTGVTIEAIHAPTGEGAGSLSFRRMNAEGQQWAAPMISVDLDHQQRGLATEMVRRLSAKMPTSTFNWHDFSSEGGLAVAKKAVEANPRQHILREDFVHGGGD